MVVSLPSLTPSPPPSWQKTIKNTFFFRHPSLTQMWMAEIFNLKKEVTCAVFVIEFLLYLILECVFIFVCIYILLQKRGWQGVSIIRERWYVARRAMSDKPSFLLMVLVAPSFNLFFFLYFENYKYTDKDRQCKTNHISY